MFAFFLQLVFNYLIVWEKINCYNLEFGSCSVDILGSDAKPLSAHTRGESEVLRF